ncbi:MAG: O-antigen ligase family protein [Deltaproteobacteria bacterium]|nr:O-antigen ligase family protein [Deltaproteobacteria bacterium]
MERIYTGIRKFRDFPRELLYKENWRGRSLVLLIAACGLGIVTAYSVWVGLLATICFAYCFVVYLNPIYGIYITIFFIPIMTINIVYDNPTRTPHELYPLGAVFFLFSYAAMMIRRGVLGDHGREVRSNGRYILLFFVAWCAVTFFWTLDSAHGLNMFVMLLLGIMVMQIIENDVIDRKAVRSIMVCVAISGFIWAGIMLFSFYWYGTIYEARLMERISVIIEIFTENKRIGGFGPPQSASNTLGMVIFFLVALWPDAGWRARIFYLIVGYLCVMAMLIAASKGAIGALLAGLVLTILIDAKLRRKAILMVSSVVAFFVIVYLLNIVLLNQQRLTASTKVATASLTARLGFWDTGFKSLFEDRWFGNGIGGYASLVDPVPGAHSIYFDVLFDGGVIAIVLFILFVLIRFFSDRMDLLRRNDDFYSRKYNCLVGALAMFFIHSLVDLSYISRHFWMMLGISGAMAAIARRESTSKGAASD